MSKLWALTKVLLKTNFLSGIGDSKKQKNRYLGIFGLGLLFLFVICSLGVPIVLGINGILEVLPIQNIIISFILPIAGITTIVFSIFSVVSVFYLSKDSEHLLPLPIEAKDIMLSKFLVSLVNEYYILIMFIFPCLLGVGIGINASVLYYVYTFVIFLLLPIIPTVIVTFIILIITRFTGVMKNKDLFVYISMGIILLFSFGYNYVVQTFMTGNIDNLGSTIGDLENAILPYFKMMFPFYNSASSALSNYNNLNGAFSLLTFVAFNFIAILFIYFLGDKLYLKTVISTSGNKKKDMIVEDVFDAKGNQGSFVWLLKKEWLIIKRTPIFMLNIVIIIFIMPLVVIFSFLITSTQEGSEMSLFGNVNSIQGYLDNPIVFLIVISGILFLTSTSMAASTSISREGSSAWVMKIIPVSYFKQINVKVFFAVVLDMLAALIVAIVPIILYEIPAFYVVCVFVPVLILVCLLNYINIFLDLRRPKLKWSEESAAVKQNLNGVYSILITMAVCAFFGILAYVFYKSVVNINVIALSVVISLISGIILAFVIYMFYKNKDKLLENVD